MSVLPLRDMYAVPARKLAAELGVTPMALYWHFRSKDELLSGLVERVWTEIDLDLDRTVPWPDQLRTLFQSLLAVLRAERAGPGMAVTGGTRAGPAEEAVIFSTLPPGTYPQLVECAVAMTSNDDQEFHYGLGVSLFIAGVEAIAARQYRIRTEALPPSGG